MLAVYWSFIFNTNDFRDEVIFFSVCNYHRIISLSLVFLYYSHFCSYFNINFFFNESFQLGTNIIFFFGLCKYKYQNAISFSRQRCHDFYLASLFFMFPQFVFSFSTMTSLEATQYSSPRFLFMYLTLYLSHQFPLSVVLSVNSLRSLGTPVNFLLFPTLKMALVEEVITFSFSCFFSFFFFNFLF